MNEQHTLYAHTPGITDTAFNDLVTNRVLIEIPVVAQHELVRFTCNKYGCGINHAEGHLVTYRRLVSEWQRADE